MKALVISPKRLKKELIIFTICFIIAFIMNIIAIIRFKTPWYEMFTQIGYVLIITISIYFIIVLFRSLLFLIRKLIALFGNKESQTYQM